MYEAFLPGTLRLMTPDVAPGQPAISLPLGQSGDGLPIGVPLVARYGEEATLFRLAAQLEQVQPWASRRPKIVAAG